MSYPEEALAYGVERHRAGHLNEARSLYESLISHSLDPSVNGAALAHLATLHLKQDRVQDAVMAATQALHLNSDNGTALLAWLQCQRRLGSAEQSIEALGQRSTHGLPPAILHELGMCHEAVGEYRKAYLCFKEAKRRISFTNLDVDRTLLLRYMSDITHARFQVPDSTERDSHASCSHTLDPIFLVGFNESGVTELGQMLGKHPGFRLAAELPAIVEARQQLGGKDPKDLSKATPCELESARTAYYAAADRVAAGDGRIVDALPLNLLASGLVRTMFPNATIIHCVRHPYDAVIETFKRPYALNNVTCHFDRLERTALSYAGIMSLSDKLNTIDGIEMTALRYEDLMTHPNEIVEAIAFDAGLKWEGVPRFAPRTALPRWEHYAKEMSRWLPTLSPIAERFGYPAK